MASMFGQIRVTDRPKFAEATHKFLIRTVKLHTYSTGYTKLQFDLRAEDEENPLFEGFSVKMDLPVFPDLKDGWEDEQSPSRLSWMIQSMDNFVHVMTALGVPESDLDEPDLDSFSGLYVTAFGRWKTQQDGQEVWTPNQKSLKLDK